MRKDLKKNKKGFTLVEIIVVLLIIGILLAITIPSIMGYVGKAKNAQIEAEARSGYVAAQTIVARTTASGKALVNGDDGDKNTVTKATVNKELNDDKTITAAGCEYDADGKNIVRCAFKTNTGKDKVVIFDTLDKEEPTKTLDALPADSEIKLK